MRSPMCLHAHHPNFCFIAHLVLMENGCKIAAYKAALCVQYCHVNMHAAPAGMIRCQTGVKRQDLL